MPCLTLNVKFGGIHEEGRETQNQKADFIGGPGVFVQRQLSFPFVLPHEKIIP